VNNYPDSIEEMRRHFESVAADKRVDPGEQEAAEKKAAAMRVAAEYVGALAKVPKHSLTAALRADFGRNKVPLPAVPLLHYEPESGKLVEDVALHLATVAADVDASSAVWRFSYREGDADSDWALSGMLVATLATLQAAYRMLLVMGVDPDRLAGLWLQHGLSVDAADAEGMLKALRK
jgi:hypothetical protein